MTTVALALIFVGALIRTIVAALSQKHVRSLDLEYKRRATAVPPPVSEVQEDAAEAGGALHDVLHR